MKKRMKTKRYYEGEDVRVDDDNPESQRVYRSDLTEISDEERMPRGAMSVARKAAQTGVARAKALEARGAADTSQSPSMTESPSNAIVGSGAAFDRRKLTGAGSYSRLDEDARSGKKARPMTDRERQAMEAAGLAATMIPAGRVAKGVYEVGKAADTARRMGNAVKAYDAEKAAAAGERAAKLADIEKKSAEAKRARDISRAREDMFGSQEAAKDAAKRGLMRRGGSVKRYSSGGSVKSSASRRADGIATKGKTKGRFI